MEYYRVCRSLKDKGLLIPVKDDLSEVYSLVKKDSDAYLSMFKFNEEHKKLFDEIGSVAGITDVKTSFLVWDFDSESSIEAARQDLAEVILRLKKMGYTNDQLEIYFSGNKGFELRITIKQDLTPTEAKSICLGLANDLPTVDDKIYNATRVMRLPSTKHNVSGLYKYPLTVEEVFSLSGEEIRKGSVKVPYEQIKGFWSKADLKPELIYLKNTPLKSPKPNSQLIKSMDIAGLNREAMPKGWDLARWAIFNGYFDKGNRSTALLCMASYLMKSFTADHTYRMLKGTCELQAQRTGDERFPDTELYNNIIMQVYGPNWNGGTYSLTDPNSWLHQYAAEMGLLAEASCSVSKDILTADQVGNLFAEFATNIDKNRIQFGIKELDEALDVLIGRVYIIAGSPGSGKSSLLIQIFDGLSAQGNKAIYFSFDMSLQDNFQKIIQKEFKITAKQLYEEYKNPKRRELFHKVFNEKYSNIIFINSSGMTIEQMRERITEAEKVHGEIKVVAVDYMTLTQTEKSDSNEHSKSIIQGLKAIATDMRKCVISLNQPNKANQKINEPLSGYGGIQGSSAVQELANAILWVYRPGANPTTFEKDKYYSIECMKNRHGGLFSIDLAWNGLTGTVRSMTAVERMDLNTLRDELKSKNKEDLY